MLQVSLPWIYRLDFGLQFWWGEILSFCDLDQGQKLNKFISRNHCSYVVVRRTKIYPHMKIDKTLWYSLSFRIHETQIVLGRGSPCSVASQYHLNICSDNGIIVTFKSGKNFKISFSFVIILSQEIKKFPNLSITDYMKIFFISLLVLIVGLQIIKGVVVGNEINIAVKTDAYYRNIKICESISFSPACESNR